MQLSNGLSDPIGLWLGHLLWDSVFGVVIATVIIIIFAAVSNQFYGLGLFVGRFCSRSSPAPHRTLDSGSFLYNTALLVRCLRIARRCSCHPLSHRSPPSLDIKLLCIL